MEEEKEESPFLSLILSESVPLDQLLIMEAKDRDTLKQQLVAWMSFYHPYRGIIEASVRRWQKYIIPSFFLLFLELMFVCKLNKNQSAMKAMHPGSILASHLCNPWKNIKRELGEKS